MNVQRREGRRLRRRGYRPGREAPVRLGELTGPLRSLFALRPSRHDASLG
jgi:hypothetical protein